MSNFPFSLSFGTRGDFNVWAAEGWHHDPNDKDHTWAAQVANLVFPLSRTRDRLSITIDIIPPEGFPQDVFLYFNGGLAAFWRVKEAGLRTGVVHPQLLRMGENLVTIVCPNAICPKELGRGDDQRWLGVAVRKLTLSSAPAKE